MGIDSLCIVMYRERALADSCVWLLMVHVKFYGTNEIIIFIVINVLLSPDLDPTHTASSSLHELRARLAAYWTQSQTSCILDSEPD